MLLAIRIVLVLIYFFVIAFLGTLMCLFRPFNPDNTPLCGRMFSWGGIKLMGIKLVLEGREQLNDWQPSIVVANHQSNLDLFVMGSSVPPRTVTIGKKSLKFLPLFGQVYWLAGNILIDRSKRMQSINTMTQIAEAIHSENTSIWVFPEGTRNSGKTLLPFKKGAFYMAMNANVPIVPICASSYMSHINLNRWRAGTIVVKILPPIPTAGLESDQLGTLITETQTLMQDTIVALNQRIEADAKHD